MSWDECQDYVILWSFIGYLLAVEALYIVCSISSIRCNQQHGNEFDDMARASLYNQSVRLDCLYNIVNFSETRIVPTPFLSYRTHSDDIFR